MCFVKNFCIIEQKWQLKTQTQTEYTIAAKLKTGQIDPI